MTKYFFLSIDSVPPFPQPSSRRGLLDIAITGEYTSLSWRSLNGNVNSRPRRDAMANFCTKCGSALPEGGSFCTACGTPAAGTGAPAAGVTPPSAIQPSSASPLKIILIIVAVFVGIGILTSAVFFFGVWRLSRAVKVSPGGGRVSIATPLGNLTTDTAPVSEAELGVPLYPNAKRSEGSMNITTPKGSMATYIFTTTDSPAQVIEFYRSKLDAKTNFMETPDGGMITSAKGEGDKEGFMITVGRGEGGKTAITIIRGRS
jgi:hypothetical protein